MSVSAHEPAARHAVPGAPCWVSLMARDLAAAQDFYSAVLGWTFQPGMLGGEFSVALFDGRPVAGLGALAHTLHVPVSWTPYFAVPSADDVTARVRERGATVAVGPLRFAHGRAALAADLDGAVFGVWEGTVLPWSVGRGSAPAWLELRTRDAFAAAIFYGEVLRWAVPGEAGCEVDYAQGQVLVSDGTHAVAGLRGGAIEEAPDPSIRPRWHVYFPCSDVDTSMKAAVAAGGSVVQPPRAGAHGYEATLRDPDGGLFTVTTVRGRPKESTSVAPDARPA
ncbi:VOC family protein [Streptomyces buecherae]|uniref:VOC family protein n=1 Tax=Streptomyces buecherae TaxID=2763006 RepID=UPI0033883658